MREFITSSVVRLPCGRERRWRNSRASGEISQRRFTRVQRKYRGSILQGLERKRLLEGRNYEFHAFGRGAIVGADDNSPGFTGARTP